MVTTVIKFSIIFSIQITILNLTFLSLATAKQVYGFANVSLNYLDWSEKTEERSKVFGTKKDFTYVEFEGGSGYDWGSLYGFYDIENLGHSPDGSDAKGLRTAAKGNITVNILQSNWRLYGHIYQFATDDIKEQNRVMGVAYDLRVGRFWFQPFVGNHDVVTVINTPKSVAKNGISFDGYSGQNGVMLGWVMSYAINDDLQTLWWHETELNRPDENGINGIHKKNYGHNGAISLWLEKYKPFQVGLQYRYADRKLGTPDYQDALIFSFKYNL